MCAVPVRSGEEVEGVRQACLVARRVLDAAHAAVRPGVTTDEIDRIVRMPQLPRPCAAPAHSAASVCQSTS